MKKVGKSGKKWRKVVKSGEKWRKSTEKLGKSGEKWLGVAICGFMRIQVVLCG